VVNAEEPAAVFPSHGSGVERGQQWGNLRAAANPNGTLYVTHNNDGEVFTVRGAFQTGTAYTAATRAAP
jgi:hypothetical protein